MAGVTVVGAGVIGLTIAHELAVAGHRVRVLAARDAQASVSSVAAAIWFPHDVQRTPQVMASAAATYEKLLRLSKEPSTGVRMRTGTVLSRRPDPDLEWTSAVPSHERLDNGVRCTVPLVVTNLYLDWLRSAVIALGVAMQTVQVTALEQLHGGDVLVVAAGLRSARLLGDDDQTYPIRGQVVRLANPGLTDWVIDDENPGGLTYVVPRDDDVVCGGTGEVGSWDEAVDPEIEASILQRARELVPELREQPVLSRAVGLRPARSSVRLEAVTGHGRPVFACYGHGGAGFTLSWGDAAVIARLVESA